RLVDVFVRPIEERGIPSFPIFVLIIFAIAAGAWFIASGGLAPPTPETKEWRVSVSGAQGEALEGALVTITIEGKEYAARTNAKGVASFSNLPLDKKGRVTVSLEGFAEATQEFSTSNALTRIRLSPAAVARENKLVVTVKNSDGEPLGGATLSFVDPATGETRTLYTDATGRAKIFFENSEDFFNVRASLDGFTPARKTCFASVGYCDIELLTQKNFCSGSECEESGGGGTQEAKGSVRVEVKNEAGESIAARVTLFNADSVESITAGYSTATGPAFFKDVAALGTSVFVVVDPESAEYAPYNGGELNEVQIVSVETVFQVTLQPSSAVPKSRADFRIVDENAAPVVGASLSLYSLNNPLRVIASASTNEDGEASFEISPEASVYLTVFADGFLPFVERSVEPGTEKTIVLTARVAGNNAVARALVVDDEGAPQELARVFVVTADGFFTGVPPQETSADGSTEFSGLPLEEIGFRATLGSRAGKSDFFTPAIDETINATVVLEPEMGVLAVGAVDAASGDAVAARFEAVLVDSKKSIGSCVANASANYSCELRVKAGKAFVVKASAVDYAPAETEQMVLAAEQRLEKKVKMVSLKASRELKIISFELQPLAQTAQGTAGGDAKQVDRGRFYRALLTVAFPGGSDASGVFLRVGDKKSASEDFAAITFFDDDENASIVWSSNWGGDAAACVEDLAVQDGSEAKWVNWEFTNFFGTRTIAAKVFVKPSARSKDKLRVYYRAYSKKKDVVTRAPFDEELGFVEKTRDKDWCRAATLSRSYSVVEGESDCSQEACLSVAFAEEGGGGVQGDGFKAATGSKFEARVEARSFTGASAAMLRVAAGDESLSLHEWSFNGAAGGAGGERSAQIPLRFNENGEASGVLLVKARLPSQQALLKFSLSEDNRVVAEAQKFVVVEGLARLALEVSPQNVSAQTPFSLTATVKRADDGSAVEDARVFLREVEGGGSPFDGFPNGDYAIRGDASEGKGKEGRFAFKRLLASSPGVFEVIAERDGFKEAAASVSVAAVDFLEFSRDLSDLRLGCDAVSLEVSSALGLDVPVTASFNGAQCVALHAPASIKKDENTWFFEVKRGKSKKLELEPLRNGKCYLVFNSVLPASGSASSATAWLTVNCSKFEVAPSPTVAPTNCSSESCEKCSERECLALNEFC
ncbi:MAG: carboxypeptidase-like regulatory domain-containing protein, partial [Candidatus Norongarragalinales archaeon]